MAEKKDKAKSLTILQEFEKRRKEWMKIWGPGILIVTLGVFIASFFVQPAPPKKITIAAGGQAGMYYHFARQYADFFREHKIELEVRETAGSLENLKLLQAGEVDLAIVQGGTAPKPAPAGLETIASLYFEPVWVFHRGDPLTDLRQLAGKHVSIGPEGSGTRAIALLLLDDNGVVDGVSTEPLTGQASKFYGMSTADAALALRDGRIDAAFFVVGPDAAVVRDLLTAPDIRLMDFARHAAYPHRYGYLSSVTLHEGVIDLQRNLPPRDVHLLAPAANLVATEELHSALPQLLIDIASRVHGRGGLLTRNDQFPNLDYAEFPINESARRYFKNGPTFLHRYLPFWLASFIERMWILALPLITLLFPLFKIGPPLYRWQIRSRIFRWYRIVRAVDKKLLAAEDLESLTEDLDKLRRMEQELAEVWVPWSYMEEFYHLRTHIAFIHQRIEERLRDGNGANGEANGEADGGEQDASPASPV